MEGSNAKFAKHKRGRRKKFQKEYQEKQKEQMILQLERRFQQQNQNTSSTIREIPLPSEGSGDTPRLTETDYDNDYLTDPIVVSAYSGEIRRSERIVKKADEAEVYMMTRCGSKVSTVLDNFRTRILEVSRQKRRLQTNVPYIKYKFQEETLKEDEKMEDDSTCDTSESGSSSSSSSEDNDEGEEGDERKIRNVSKMRLEVERKKTHPNGLHPDISFNEPGISNDGPECRCPPKARVGGVRHGCYLGEEREETLRCSERSELYSYILRVTPSPNENQTFKTNMLVNGDEFLFEGFSLITHSPLPDSMTQRPICKYSMDFDFQLVEEPIPDGCFCAEDADEMTEYIFHEIFEMFDFNLRPVNSDSCPILHLMPRFTIVKDGSVHLWSTKTALAFFLIKGSQELFDRNEMVVGRVDEDTFSRQTARMKQSIVLNARHKPSAIRADWFELEKPSAYLIHNAIRFRTHATANLPRIGHLERRIHKLSRRPTPELETLRKELETLRTENRAARNLRLRQIVTGYTDTGLKPDVVAHVAMAILATHHVRYHFGISAFEQIIEYQFSDRKVIELAMLHSSLKSNYGTPTDHVKNMVSNCGYRRKYGSEEKREKKKGIVNLFNIVNGQSEVEPIVHNERLEYLGDAVVELIVSHHLFFMLPHHYEGGLATYRTSLVQNRNLASLALNCRVDRLLQYAHGAELCHEAEWKHALANAFEALIAAVYLDGGIAACDRIFSKAMFESRPELKSVWDHVNEHELKREDPLGDRELSHITPTLGTFHKLEANLGVQFNNVRLLAKAFTRRNVAYNDLTKGHNQRLEWLGDSVLQLVISDYLYRHFPFHHEGHMSLLRTSLVSNQTQSVVCDDLGFQQFVLKTTSKPYELKMKDKADLVEAFIGALYVDRGIEHCRTFVRTVFCPRLKHFIDNERWNDAKSHLQQWCLTMRDDENPEPAMPEYRVLGIEGPTNNRIYRVAVYFRGKRLASADASNVHNAELRAAELALAGVETANYSKIGDARKNKRPRRRR